MEMRIQRTISVHPKLVRDFIALALETEAHASGVMGVESDLFYSTERSDTNAKFTLFTDFASFAQYEDVFLGKLLHDKKYLALAAKGVGMITDEPLDELFVRLKPDDFFMNIGKKNRVKYSFETAKHDVKAKRRRYRREREYSAAKGRLREVMSMNFEFMQDFFNATSNVPDFFCTRFSVQRIGSSKMYFDVDDCPMCEPAFIEQNHTIATKTDGLLLTRPIDRVHVRITDEHAAFSLRAHSR